MTTLPQTAPLRLPRASIPSQLAMPGPMHPGYASPGAGQHGFTAGDVWRVLRANMWLIVIMVMASAIAGYFVNVYLAKNYSRYTAVGLMDVRVSSEVPVPEREGTSAAPAEVELAQNTQRSMLKHETLFIEALNDPEAKIRSTKWFQQFQGKRDPLAAMKKDIEDHFDAVPIPSTRLVRVEMTYEDPGDAKTIVEAMIGKHIEKVREQQHKVESDKVTLLSRKLSQTDLELKDINNQVKGKATLLGDSQVGTYMNWNGKQFQLDRLLQESARIQTELSGYKARLASLTHDLEEGRVPAIVEREMNSNSLYLSYKQRVDDVDVEIKAMGSHSGEQNNQIVGLKLRRAALQQKFDEYKEELRSTYADEMKALLQDEINATNVNFTRVGEAILSLGTELGKLNDAMNDYREALEYQKELKKQTQTLKDRIDELNLLHLQSSWSTADWASHPQLPDRPSFPKLAITMTVAIMLGLGLSLGIAFLREMMDTTVRSPRDLARVGQLNLLGMIPHEQDDPQASGGRLQLAIFDSPHSMVAEQFRHVRTKLQHMSSLDTTRTILVTSPSPGDGKTTVACNLAASLALNGRRILLVDANFRRPQVHAVFGMENEGGGFGDVLNSPELLESVVRETDVPNLSVLLSGPRPANAAELLESQLFIDFIEQAMERYDHVIFDSGPLMMVSESVAMAPRVDGVVTVVRASGNSRGLLMRLRDELRKIRAEHLGVVLNAVRAQGGGYYGRNIKTFYAYQNQ